MKISKFIELSKWFNRKSQHYIMGDWFVYAGFKERVNYIKGYPMAYIRFMRLSKEEWR